MWSIVYLCLLALNYTFSFFGSPGVTQKTVHYIRWALWIGVVADHLPEFFIDFNLPWVFDDALWSALVASIVLLDIWPIILPGFYGTLLHATSALILVLILRPPNGFIVSDAKCEVLTNDCLEYCNVHYNGSLRNVLIVRSVRPALFCNTSSILPMKFCVEQLDGLLPLEQLTHFQNFDYCGMQAQDDILEACVKLALQKTCCRQIVEPQECLSSTERSIARLTNKRLIEAKNCLTEPLTPRCLDYQQHYRTWLTKQADGLDESAKLVHTFLMTQEAERSIARVHDSKRSSAS